MKVVNIPVYHLLNTSKEKSHFELIIWNHEDNCEMELPHKHNYYEVLFFYKGGGTHEIDFVKNVIQSNSLHFIPKGSVDKVYRTKNSSGCSFLFSDIFFQHYLPKRLINFLPFKSSNLSPILNLVENEFLNITTLIEKIKKSCNNSSKNANDLIGNYLNILFTYVSLYYLNRNEKDNPYPNVIKGKIIKEFQQLIEQHYIKHYSVQQYAEILCTAPNYLNELCKKELGITSQHLVKGRLLTEAKKMLFYSNKEIKEVAYALGFCDPAHFSQFFKKYTGHTPTEFQLQHSNFDFQ